MSIKNSIQYLANAGQYCVSLAQVEQWARIVALVLSILTTLWIFIDKVVTWWKKAKKDGKIDKDELNELKGIIHEGSEAIKNIAEDHACENDKREEITHKTQEKEEE